MKRIENKVAIVTGAASGIGRAIAILFAKEGARQVISDVNMTGLAETAAMCAAECRAIGGSDADVKFIHCDVSNTEEVEAMVDLCLSSYGTVDILINNPGFNPFAPFIVAQEDEILKALDIGCVGAFRCSKAVLPTMTDKNYGKIVNITSIMSVIAGRGQSSYNASKGALKMLTQGMALDLAPYQINVNAVGPGMIRTGMTRDLFANKEREEWFISKIPMGRLGVPEDIATAALFLSTDEASFITGTTLFVDGGQIATA